MTSAPRPPRARLISCGDELICGQTVDTNANWLAGRLAELGWRLAGARVIGDLDDDIAEAVDESCRQADAVIFTGGLGPTEDDRTRFAVARALGAELAELPELVRRIEQRFARLGRPMAPVNRVQALLPAGAVPLDNPAGTAPGFRARLHGADLFVLPGVPSEMKAMFDRHVLAALAGHPARGAAHIRRLHLHGIGESDLGVKLRDLMRRGQNPAVGTAVADSLITVRIFSQAPDAEAAAALTAAAEREIRARAGEYIHGVDGETLAGAVVERLRARGQTIATAESCTGGWLAGALVDVPGASEVFREGVVAYSNAAKTARLGVDAALLERAGAVREAVAKAMAAGQRERADADFALSTTGVAGPEGGTEEKPVGLAWIGLADRNQVEAIQCRAHSDRAGNRRRAVNRALDWLRRRLDGLDGQGINHS